MKIISRANNILLYLAVLFLIDVLNKEYLNFPYTELIWVKVVKVLFYCSFVVILIAKKDFRFIRKASFLVLLVGLSQGIYLLRNPDIAIQNILPVVRDLLLYLFPIIFLYTLYNEEDEKFIKRLSVLFEGIIWVTIATTIVGVIFKIQLFATYANRFGYMGLMPKSITATYFYIAALSYVYYSMEWLNRSRVLFCLLLFASLLVGTKGIYLFVFLLFGFHFFSNKWYLLKNFYVAAGVILALLITFREKISFFLKGVFSILYIVYKEQGLFTTLTSLRDKKFIANRQEYEPYWEWYNYFIGGRISSINIFEMSLVDLIAFFGILGTIYYLKTIFSLMIGTNYRKSPFLVFAIVSISFVSIFAGQLFENISAMTYVSVAIFLLSKRILNFKTNEQHTI